MIRPLRRAHRVIWIVLAILMPVLYVAGLLARRTAMPANLELEWEQYE